MITHEEISKRAREIWERENRPEGRDIEHWLQAEAELRRDSERPHQQPTFTAGPQGTMVTKSSEALSRDENARKRSPRRGR